MRRSWGQRFAIWLVTWAFRIGVPASELRQAVDQAWSYRDDAWREDVYETARQRNRGRLLRKIND